VTKLLQATKVLDTIKKYAKKALEFAREILVKVMNFLKGLFGKKEDTTSAILQLVKDAKNDGRIKLDVDEFSETIQTRLAKEMPVLLATQSGKTISGSVITDFIDKMDVTDDILKKIDIKVTDTKESTARWYKPRLNFDADGNVTSNGNIAKGLSATY